MRIILSATLLALTFAAPASAATRNFGITGFEKIRVDGPFKVRLSTGVAPFARASGSPAALDRVQGQRFEGTVAGSGGLNVAALDVQALKLSIAGSGGVKAGAGKAQTAEYEIAGSGDVDAGAIQAQQAKVSIAGSGSVRAHASGTADVSIMGSGDVDVSGGAKCSVSKMGSGEARCS